MPEQLYDYEELDRAIIKLERYSHKVRFRALIVAMATMLNLGLSFASIVLTFSPERTSYDMALFIPLVIGLMVVALVITLTLLVIYDQTKKRGDALFAQISEEIEWRERLPHNDLERLRRDEFDRLSNDKRTRLRVDVNEPKRGLLRARVIASEFARTTELPLVSGRDGPWKYATINIVIAFMAALFVGISGSFVK